jgi:hypothetical protein
MARALRDGGRFWHGSGGDRWNARISMVFVIVAVYALGEYWGRKREQSSCQSNLYIPHGFLSLLKVQKRWNDSIMAKSCQKYIDK